MDEKGRVVALRNGLPWSGVLIADRARRLGLGACLGHLGHVQPILGFEEVLGVVPVASAFAKPVVATSADVEQAMVELPSDPAPVVALPM